MKLRSKLLLSATCLLTISVAATATSAYAWFVSNRQATVSINTANVKTNATNLKIAGVVTPTADDTASFANTATADDITGTVKSNIKATDISGDGVNFYKPKLAPDFTTSHKATSISKVSNSEGKYYYHQFKLEFSQDNKDVNTGVFLSDKSSVLLSTDTTTATGLSLCTRVAFLDSDNNLLLYWAPNRAANVANKSYIKAEYKESTPVSIEDTETTTTSSVLQSVTAKTENILYNNTVYGKPTDVNDATPTANKKDAKEHLLTLKGTTAQTITVRIWFEGMDSACDSIYLTQTTTIDANLKFNGVNMDI